MSQTPKIDVGELRTLVSTLEQLITDASRVAAELKTAIAAAEAYSGQAVPADASSLPAQAKPTNHHAVSTGNRSARDRPAQGSAAERKPTPTPWARKRASAPASASTAALDIAAPATPASAVASPAPRTVPTVEPAPHPVSPPPSVAPPPPPAAVRTAEPSQASAVPRSADPPPDSLLAEAARGVVGASSREARSVSMPVESPGPSAAVSETGDLAQESTVLHPVDSPPVSQLAEESRGAVGALREGRFVSGPVESPDLPEAVSKAVDLAPDSPVSGRNGTTHEPLTAGAQGSAAGTPSRERGSESRPVESSGLPAAVSGAVDLPPELGVPAQDGPTPESLSAGAQGGATEPLSCEAQEVETAPVLPADVASAPAAPSPADPPPGSLLIEAKGGAADTVSSESQPVSTDAEADSATSADLSPTSAGSGPVGPSSEPLPTGAQREVPGAPGEPPAGSRSNELRPELPGVGRLRGERGGVLGGMESGALPPGAPLARPSAGSPPEPVPGPRPTEVPFVPSSESSVSSEPLLVSQWIAAPSVSSSDVPAPPKPAGLVPVPTSVETPASPTVSEPVMSAAQPSAAEPPVSPPGPSPSEAAPLPQRAGHTTDSEATRILRDMAARHGLETRGFEAAAVDAGTAREIVTALDDLLMKYTIPLHGIEVAEQREDTIRRERKKPVDPERTGRPPVWLTLERAELANPSATGGPGQGETRRRFRRRGSAERPVYAAVARAFAAALDEAGGYRARQEAWRTLMADSLRGGANIDSGLLDPRHALIEGFVEVELRGKRAGGSAKALHEVLVKIARAEPEESTA